MPNNFIQQFLLSMSRSGFRAGLVKGWLPVVFLLTTLACITNTPAAYVATPRPTRTPWPTFTNTPIPPTPTITFTPTNTPPATDTPVPTLTFTPGPTDTPVPTETPVPPTNTPIPPTAVPPTNTPVPTLPPAPVSVVSTPTPTPLPDTPPGRYEEDDGRETMRNCANVGVIGHVRQRNGHAPVPYVTIQVTGSKKPYKGPYTAKTNENGDYTVLIGPLSDEVDDVEFEVRVVGGSNVKSEDSPEWTADKDCKKDDAIQVIRINWKRKEPN